MLRDLQQEHAATAVSTWCALGAACADIADCDDPGTLLAAAALERVPVDVALDVVARSILTHPFFLDLPSDETRPSTLGSPVREATYAAAFTGASDRAALLSAAALLEHCAALGEGPARSVIVATSILASARASSAHPELALFLAQRAIAVIAVTGPRAARKAHRTWTVALCSYLRAAIAGWRDLETSRATPC